MYIFRLVYKSREFCYINHVLETLEDEKQSRHVQAIEFFINYYARQFVNHHRSRDFPTKYDFIIVAYNVQMTKLLS